MRAIREPATHGGDARRGTAGPRVANPPRRGSHGLLELQRTVGNRAVAAALAVQRDAEPTPAAPTRAVARGSLTRSSLLPGPEFFAPPPIPSRVRDDIESWLDSRKLAISLQNDAGTISMPEVVAQIREEVTGAADVEAFQVEMLARSHLGHAAPPRTRQRPTPTGQASELAARLKNLLGKKVEVGTDAANLVISVSGAVAQVRAGPVQASAEAGTGGVSGRVRVGRGTVTASPDSFALKATIPMGGTEGVFAASLKKKGDAWSSWSTSFSFPIVGRTVVDARPAVAAIGASVREAEQAIGEIAGHLHAGGMPTDAFVRERIGQVTPAIDRVGSAVKRQDGPSVTVRIGASGGPREVAGHRVQEASVGVSLVVAF